MATNEWLNEWRGELSRRKAASGHLVHKAIDGLQQAVHFPVPLFFEGELHSTAGAATLSDTAKQQVAGLSDILARLGIRNISSVQAATYAHSPIEKEAAAELTHNG